MAPAYAGKWTVVSPALCSALSPGGPAGPFPAHLRAAAVRGDAAQGAGDCAPGVSGAAPRGWPEAQRPSTTAARPSGSLRGQAAQDAAAAQKTRTEGCRQLTLGWDLNKARFCRRGWMLSLCAASGLGDSVGGGMRALARTPVQSPFSRCWLGGASLCRGSLPLATRCWKGWQPSTAWKQPAVEGGGPRLRCLWAGLPWRACLGGEQAPAQQRSTTTLSGAPRRPLATHCPGSCFVPTPISPEQGQHLLQPSLLEGGAGPHVHK